MIIILMLIIFWSRNKGRFKSVKMLITLIILMLFFFLLVEMSVIIMDL